MEALQEILETNKIQQMQEKYLKNLRSSCTYDEMRKRFCEIENEKQGDLEGYDCPICKNKGMIHYYKDGLDYSSHCKCMKTRHSLKLIEKSGLKYLLDSCTFDKYEALDDWNKLVKQKAIEYIKNFESGYWFFVGGQSGSGKTHICTAICGELLKQNKAVAYMMWRDISVQLKACVNNDIRYQEIIKPLKTIEVLYVDDLFKTKDGGEATNADVGAAFEILNYRINNNLSTIISCEKSLNEIIDIDEAVGGRIRQKTGGIDKFAICIKKADGRNYRMRG